MTTPTTLGYALMGLLDLEPRSGYALRQVFATSPMGLYSSSPGAIYPALKSLQKLGLVEKSAPADVSNSKPVFNVTSKGKRVFQDWLKSPVTSEDVERREGELMLRFSMMAGHLNNKEIIDFLKSLEEKSREYHTSLIAYLDQHTQQMGPVPSAAVQCGIDLVQTRADWARKTRKTLQDIHKDG